ncbi:MAG: LapA family protein [Anaerolineae bacterium]|nr:LapA family protein [Anaerolineae bacterium]
MRERLSTLGFRLRLGLSLLALALFVVFLLQNTDAMRVRFLFLEADIAGAIVIIVTSLLGFIGGILLTLNWQRQRHKEQASKETGEGG